MIRVTPYVGAFLLFSHFQTHRAAPRPTTHAPTRKLNSKNVTSRGCTPLAIARLRYVTPATSPIQRPVEDLAGGTNSPTAKDTPRPMKAETRDPGTYIRNVADTFGPKTLVSTPARASRNHVVDSQLYAGSTAKAIHAPQSTHATIAIRYVPDLRSNKVTALSVRSATLKACFELFFCSELTRDV
jgi:hypothetical protein